MGQVSALSAGAPVFVLCGARSGSTLLRFILDAHPELACPPETNIPGLCAQLATVWSLIEGAPLSPDRGTEPPIIPDAAITGIRHTVDLMIDSYLARRGGKRYCDKSLSTARFADLLCRVYPETKFLCLYRHPMDMIASGIEACPWGLRGYGFDPYIAGSPGNIVLALARYWIDNATAILRAQEQFPESCHRVRYEDLVTDPEGTAAAVFKFLDVPPAPGITESCFTAERERSGPADYKIWHTSQVVPASMGRGWTLPIGQLSDSVLEQLNELAERLGYLQIDGQWGTTAAPLDLRAANGSDAYPRCAAISGEDNTVRHLGQRLREGLTKLGSEFARRWGPAAGAPFGIFIAEPARGSGLVRWRVDLAAGTATLLTQGEEDATEWDVLGSARAWEAVLEGRVNLGVALRGHELRYCDTGSDGRLFTADTRIDMLGDFLGLASWPAAEDLKQTVSPGR